MDAATRTHLRHERSRLLMLRLGVIPNGKIRYDGKEPGRRSVLPENWEEEVEIALEAHRRANALALS